MKKSLTYKFLECFLRGELIKIVLLEPYIRLAYPRHLLPPPRYRLPLRPPLPHRNLRRPRPSNKIL